MVCGVLFQVQKEEFVVFLLVSGDLGGINFFANFFIEVDRLGKEGEGALALTSSRRSLGFVDGMS